MIEIGLTKAGTVVLRAKSERGAKALRSMPFVKRKTRALGATYWTYLNDVRRACRGLKLLWGPEVVGTLRYLKSRVERMKEGNHTGIRRLFAEDRQPYDYQCQAILAGINTERLVIADDTGLGKTPESWGIFLAARALGRAKRAIFVVPAGLKVQWHDEMHEFAKNFSGEIKIAMPGSRAKRRRLYASEWTVLLINPELVRIDYGVLRRVCRSVDFVALDEASCIRNGSSKTARCMKGLFSKTRYRIAMTATPMETRLADLYSIFEFVDRRAFLSKNYFDDRYVVWRKSKFMVTNRKGNQVRVIKKEPKSYKNLREVAGKIKPFYIRRRVRDVGIELPDLIVSWETLTLSKKQREVYDKVKEKTKEEIDTSGLRGAALRAPLMGLRQVCNSTALVTKKQSKPSQVKVDRIKELLETELAGEQVIIFTDYERFGELLKRELRQYKPATYTGKMGKRERQLAVDQFRAGHKRILIGTSALERGHNLQNAAIVINADLPFNPAAIKQRLGRVRRVGSKHETVRMINMIVLDTVEEYLVLKRIYSRRETFEGIFDADELSFADPIESMAGVDVKSLL